MHLDLLVLLALVTALRLFFICLSTREKSFCYLLFSLSCFTIKAIAYLIASALYLSQSYISILRIERLLSLLLRTRAFLVRKKLACAQAMQLVLILRSKYFLGGIARI
jgi:hypothetical protein